MTTVQFELPDELAKIAQEAGMLTPQALQQLLQDAIKRQQLKAAAQPFATDDPAFGMWRDREDMTDVAAYVRKLRQPRYRHDGTRNDS